MSNINIIALIRPYLEENTIACLNYEKIQTDVNEQFGEQILMRDIKAEVREIAKAKTLAEALETQQRIAAGSAILHNHNWSSIQRTITSKSHIDKEKTQVLSPGVGFCPSRLLGCGLQYSHGGKAFVLSDLARDFKNRGRSSNFKKAGFIIRHVTRKIFTLNELSSMTGTRKPKMLTPFTNEYFDLLKELVYIICDMDEELRVYYANAVTSLIEETLTSICEQARFKHKGHESDVFEDEVDENKEVFANTKKDILKMRTPKTENVTPISAKSLRRRVFTQTHNVVHSSEKKQKIHEDAKQFVTNELLTESAYEGPL